MHDATVRAAAADDAALLARIGVQSWRETYAGLLSPGLLAGLDDNSFHGRTYWKRALAQRRPHQWIWLIELDAPIGLCKFGSDEEGDGGGVVDRLYLLRPAQRQGLGRRLMAMAARLLTIHKLLPLSVWTLECNLPAQAFYERLGGRHLPRRQVFEDEGVPVFEVGFRWDEPDSLARLSASRW